MARRMFSRDQFMQLRQQGHTLEQIRQMNDSLDAATPADTIGQGAYEAAPAGQKPYGYGQTPDLPIQPTGDEGWLAALTMGGLGPLRATAERMLGPKAGNAAGSVTNDLLQYASHRIPGSAEMNLIGRLLSRFGGGAAGTAEVAAPRVTGTAVWGGPAAFSEATQAATPAAEAAEEAVPEGFTRVTTHIRRLPKGAQARTVTPAPVPPAPSVGKIVPGPGAPVMPMPARAALGNAGGNLEDLLSQSLRYGQAMQQAGINNPADQALLWQALRGQQ